MVAIFLAWMVDRCMPARTCLCNEQCFHSPALAYSPCLLYSLHWHTTYPQIRWDGTSAYSPHYSIARHYIGTMSPYGNSSPLCDVKKTKGHPDLLRVVLSLWVYIVTLSAWWDGGHSFRSPLHCTTPSWGGGGGGGTGRGRKN